MVICVAQKKGIIVDCKDCKNFEPKEVVFDHAAALAFIKQKFEKWPELKEFGFYIDTEKDLMNINHNYPKIVYSVCDKKIVVLAGFNTYTHTYHDSSDPQGAWDAFWAEWCKVRPQVVLAWLNKELPGELWDNVKCWSWMGNGIHESNATGIITGKHRYPRIDTFGYHSDEQMQMLFNGHDDNKMNWIPFSKAAFIEEYRRQHPKEAEVSIKRLGDRIKIVATKPGTTEPVWVYIPMSQAGEVAKALQMFTEEE